MPINDSRKTDFLWKKVIYGVTQSLFGGKEGPNEAISSPLLLFGSTVWSEDVNIPRPAPTGSAGVVERYSGLTAIRCTADPSVAGNRTWLATSTFGTTTSRLIDWIPPVIDASYVVQVYAGNPNSGGVLLNQLATDEEWVFDYASGVLNFPVNIPGAVSSGIWIEGFRYVGSKGVPVGGFALLADNSVTTSKIVDLAVTGQKLADNSVTANKIQNGAVTWAKTAVDFLLNAVRTQDIQDAAVTTSKLANLSVTGAKIAEGTIPSSKLTGTIPGSMISGGTLDAARLNGQLPTFYLTLANQTGTISDAQHGARAGGTLHAIATALSAGFMSASDKAKLDNLASVSGSNSPALALGTAASGASSQFARADHVHPLPTATQMGAVPASEKGVANGVATLDATGRVPQSQLGNVDAGFLQGLASASFLRADADTTAYSRVFGVDNVPRMFLTASLGFHGLGFQPTTLYARTPQNFAVYADGTHSNTDLEPGAGGTLILKVSPDDITYRGFAIWHEGNDGTGSGLDAGLLGGQPPSFYTNLANLVGTVPFTSFVNEDGANSTSPPSTYDNGIYFGRLVNAPSVGYTMTLKNISTLDTVGGTTAAQFLIGFDDKIFFRTASTGTAWGVWKRIPTADDYGAGSGFDADLLDGLDGTQYLAFANHTGTISDAQHGSRGGDNLHSLATTTNAGFMSSLDKVRLDTMETLVSGTVNAAVTQAQGHASSAQASATNAATARDAAVAASSSATSALNTINIRLGQVNAARDETLDARDQTIQIAANLANIDQSVERLRRRIAMDLVF